MMMMMIFFFFFFFFRFQSALLLLRTTADTNRGERVVRDARLSSLFDFSSLSLSLAFSFFRNNKSLKKTGGLLVVPGFFFHKRKKKRGVPCTHSPTSPNCALTRVLCYALKESSNMFGQEKKGVSPLSFGRLFPTKRDFTKKNRKNAPQNTHTHIIPKSLSGSLPTKKRRL